MWRRRQAWERDMEEELRAHIELRAADLVHRGLSEADALRQARLELGNRAGYQEQCRDAAGFRWADELRQDLQYTVRTLRRSPAFAATAVLSLALGVGANTAVFSVLYSTCLAPLPYRQPDRLVDVSMLEETARHLGAGTSLPNLEDWRARSQSFEALAAHQFESFVNLTGGGEAEEIQAWRLSSGLLPLLSVRPLLGRNFLPVEDGNTGPRSALLSYGLWQRRFGGSPGVLGKSVWIDGESYQIAGVMPREFAFPPRMGAVSPVIWLSLNLRPVSYLRQSHLLYVTGRLKNGVPADRANAEMNALSHGLASAYPKENAAWPAITITLLSDQHIRDLRSVLWLLLGAAGLVLLIACANVAGMLLARGMAREREFAIRRALGVSRSRLLRQLLTESLVLAAAGACAGIVAAYWSLPLLQPLLPHELGSPRIALHPAVLAFAAGLAVLTGVVFGLAPAFGSTITLGAASARPRLRATLVVAEIMLAALLLSSAGLLVESLWRASNVDLGFHPEHVLTMRVNLPQRKYDTGRKVEAFREEWLSRVAALPGAEFAGTNTAPPLNRLSASTGIEVEGIRNLADESGADFANVSADYLPAMGIPLQRGRNFAETDRPGSPRVAIVSQIVARRFFDGGEALGRRIRLDRFDGPEWFTVVGIAGDVRQERPERAPRGAVYVLSSQLPESVQGNRVGRFIVLVMRTSGDPHALAAAARSAAGSIDKDQPVADVLTMKELVDRTLAGRRLNALLVGLFALLALLLAAVGVFGLVAYAVARRTHEIGIRMALGARRSAILAMFTRESLRLGVMGVIAGTAGSLAASELLAKLLYQVKPAAPHILMAAAAFLIAAVLLATLLAARHALRVAPVIALRHD
jgi:putative ABC transport system permease protein